MKKPDPRAALNHAVAARIDGTVSSHHRRRLRRIGWEHALDASNLGYSTTAAAPTVGNRVEILVDGAEALPVIAAELAGARSHVHLTGWYFSPELDMTRGEEPIILRNLLAELAERIPVRLVVWRGAPLPLFSPSRREVRTMTERFARYNKIDCKLDSCVRLLHCHHEKTIVIDDRVAFVGGIDLTLDGGDKFDTASHQARGTVGWHDATMRIEGPAVAAVAEHFRLRWRGPAEEELPPPEPQPAAGDVELQIVRTVPEHVYKRTLPKGEFSILETYSGALRAAERLIYLENQFLWSSEIVAILADKLRNPPSDDFRLVVLLPARPNDGADVTRGQVAALIEADEGNRRFLACAIYARHGKMRDPIYVHSKIGIVDDRWLTLGSANLNEHSLFNDTEVNAVTLNDRLARDTRLRLWSEHLELPRERVDGDAHRVIDELWRPIAGEQLERIKRGEPLSHRLVMLPGVSRRSRRLTGSLQSRLYDG